MKYSYSFGKRSSKILLGTAYFGDTISEDEAFEIMDLYYDFGGRHIDTARLYADGNAEKVVARWIASRKPQELFLSTKGGFYNSEAKETPRINEAELRYDLEKSLEALKLSCIEFYWLHRDDENVPVSEIVEIMNQLVNEGKIKKFGASNWKYTRIDEANRYAEEKGLLGFSASQVRFSPAIIAPGGSADRTLADMDGESFSYYAKNKMPVAAYASQAKGFFSKMASFGEEGLSEKSKQRYLCDENVRRLEQIQKLSKQYDCSIASAVCALLCSVPNVDVFPIIGGRSAAQIEDSMKGADISISIDEIKELFGY